ALMRLLYSISLRRRSLRAADAAKQSSPSSCNARHPSRPAGRGGPHLDWEYQNRRAAVWPKLLAERTFHAPCQGIDDSKSMPRKNGPRPPSIVRDDASVGRRRRGQFDPNRAGAAGKRVTSGVCDQFGHDQAEPPAARSVHPDLMLRQDQLDVTPI